MSMEGHLQSAMKAVGQAIKLDGDGNSRVSDHFAIFIILNK